MINRPLNIYEVRCESCGGFVGLKHDAFRSETDATGRKRYWHLPKCPEPKVPDFITEWCESQRKYIRKQ